MKKENEKERERQRQRQREITLLFDILIYLIQLSKVKPFLL